MLHVFCMPTVPDWTLDSNDIFMHFTPNDLSLNIFYPITARARADDFHFISSAQTRMNANSIRAANRFWLKGLPTNSQIATLKNTDLRAILSKSTFLAHFYRIADTKNLDTLICFASSHSERFLTQSIWDLAFLRCNYKRECQTFTVLQVCGKS